MKYLIYAGLILASLWACNMDEVEVYTSSRYLFFPDSSKGLDTARFSFFHYPGEEIHDVDFYIALTGMPASEDLTYRVEVVDSLTTARAEDYEMPQNLTFPAGKTLDVLKIRCKNVRQELEKTSVTVAFRIVANENFLPGLTGKQIVKVTFDNIRTAPLWWEGDLKEYILGEYSHKKYEHLVIATGVNDWSELSLSEARELTMKFKAYLIENGITEEDGVTPMVDGIPCY